MLARAEELILEDTTYTDIEVLESILEKTENIHMLFSILIWLVLVVLSFCIAWFVYRYVIMRIVKQYLSFRL